MYHHSLFHFFLFFKLVVLVIGVAGVSTLVANYITDLISDAEDLYREYFTIRINHEHKHSR